MGAFCTNGTISCHGNCRKINKSVLYQITCYESQVWTGRPCTRINPGQSLHPIKHFFFILVTLNLTLYWSKVKVAQVYFTNSAVGG